MSGVSARHNKETRRIAIFFVLAVLAILPPLFFIKRAPIFLQVLNFSSISVVAIAFEFGYAFSYFISVTLGIMAIISMFFNPGFHIPYLTSVIFLTIIPQIPSYYNRLYKEYIISKNSLFERSKASFEEFGAELKALKEVNTSVQNQVHDILDLYEVTKKMGVSLSMVDMLLIFKEAVNKVLRFKRARVILIGASGEGAAGIAAFEISNPSFGKATAADIKNVSTTQFDQILAETVSAKKEIIYLKPPIGEAHPLKKYLNERGESFVALPLLSEGIPIGIFTISGLKEEQLENLSILTEQLALEVKKINLYEKVQELAITDGLTGIYVRRHFLERLNEEMPRARRHKLELSMLMIDLDHFKQCNDTYGHLVGDIVLRDIAKIMKEHIRQVDLLGRYGGEEFVIALPDTDKNSAASVAGRIRQSVERYKFKAYDETITMTISVGVATYPEDGDDVGALIDRADQALYKAKAEGRNRVISSS
ncbi:MAG: GGDEF domain-containing protein [Candidatus Omnitrophota bacterium]|nr:GGDEF domain-containing protein [Candidatus Omnitrophota bacterium]